MTKLQANMAGCHPFFTYFGTKHKITLNFINFMNKQAEQASTFYVQIPHRLQCFLLLKPHLLGLLSLTWNTDHAHAHARAPFFPGHDHDLQVEIIQAWWKATHIAPMILEGISKQTPILSNIKSSDVTYGKGWHFIS